MRQFIYINVVLITCLIFSLPSSADAQNRSREAKAKVIAWVDWDCLSKSYPKAKLNSVVRAAINQVAYQGAEIYGDRAFPVDLNGDGKSEYIIPLACSGVGNCNWGVFATNPSRLLGIVSAQEIYIHRRVERWSALTSYIHGSVVDGLIGTYAYRNGEYVELPGSYRVANGVSLIGYGSDRVYPVPRFVGNTPSPCNKRKRK